jgi:hypothetical protein
MERPATLKEEFYSYIMQRFTESSVDEMRTSLQHYGYPLADSASLEVLQELVLEEPTAFLTHDYHLLEKPGSLKNTFVELDDGQVDSNLTYFIDETAAEAIALNQHSAILQRSMDGKRFLVPVERIKNAFRNNCPIDYRE